MEQMHDTERRQLPCEDLGVLFLRLAAVASLLLMVRYVGQELIRLSALEWPSEREFTVLLAANIARHVLIALVLVMFSRRASRLATRFCTRPGPNAADTRRIADVLAAVVRLAALTVGVAAFFRILLVAVLTIVMEAGYLTRTELIGPTFEGTVILVNMGYVLVAGLVFVFAEPLSRSLVPVRAEDAIPTDRERPAGIGSGS